jgi:hypothetical protein
VSSRTREAGEVGFISLSWRVRPCGCPRCRFHTRGSRLCLPNLPVDRRSTRPSYHANPIPTFPGFSLNNLILACYHSACLPGSILDSISPSVRPVFLLPDHRPSTCPDQRSRSRPDLVRATTCYCLSPLAATLMELLVNVANKGLTETLNPLDRTFTENRGCDHGRLELPHPSHCSQTPLVQQFAKGTGFLHDPGKLLGSARCLRVGERISGTGQHRSRSQPPISSGSQVVPGSTVLSLDRSRVARVSHPRRMVRITAFRKDAGNPRVGKAGSVRLG